MSFNVRNRSHKSPRYLHETNSNSPIRQTSQTNNLQNSHGSSNQSAERPGLPNNKQSYGSILPPSPQISSYSGVGNVYTPAFSQGLQTENDWNKYFERRTGNYGVSKSTGKKKFLGNKKRMKIVKT